MFACAFPRPCSSPCSSQVRWLCSVHLKPRLSSWCLEPFTSWPVLSNLSSATSFPDKQPDPSGLSEHGSYLLTHAPLTSVLFTFNSLVWGWHTRCLSVKPAVMLLPLWLVCVWTSIPEILLLCFKFYLSFDCFMHVYNEL